MLSVTANNIKEFIQDEALLVFFASWCGPCYNTQELTLFESESKIPVGRVNCEENPDLATQYSIKCVPTYIFFKAGKPEKVLASLQSATSLHKEHKK